MEIIRTAAECSRFRACCFSSAALRIIRYSFLTGIRRAGKSTLLYSLVKRLVADGVNWTRIIYINFEDERLAEMASQDTLVNPYQTQTLSSGAIYMPSPGCIP